MEIPWIVEVIHGAIFELWASKNVLERKSTPIAGKVKKGKMVKTSKDHNFLLGTRNLESK